MNTTCQFIQKAIKIHGNEFDYSLVDYRGNKIKTKIICKYHGIFLQRPNDHLQGKGCPGCRFIKLSETKTFTQDDFIKKAINVHGNKYDYSNTVYEKHDKYITIICPEHGSFTQRAVNHMAGHGCKKCKSDKIHGRNVYSKEEFINKAIEVHGSKYDYSDVDYVGWNVSVKIMCPKHGAFFQIPSIHLQEHGCPKCSSSHGEMKIQKWLDKNKVKYVYQKTFSDCRGVGNGMLRFDFYIPIKNTLVEFDGKQHIKSGTWVSCKHVINDKELLSIQQNDKIKNDYVKSKNINILRISYKNIKKIDEILENHSLHS